MIKYPAGIDSSIELPTVIDNSTAVAGITVNNLRDAIIAIETELGIKPSGIYSTVRSRIVALELAVANISGGGSIAFGGDLFSVNSVSQKVIGIQGRPVSPIAPTLNQTYVWDGSTWIPGTVSNFIAAGDLSGNASSQTVIGLRGRVVANIAPSDGYALTWDALNNYWAPAVTSGIVPDATTVIKGKVQLAGDIGGTASSVSVLKINGTSVPATPSANQTLLATNGTTASWGLIANANVSGAAAIDGSKIVAATNFVSGVIRLTGDLSGNATSPVVAKLQTFPVNAATPLDGYVLTWKTSDGYWSAKDITTDFGSRNIITTGTLSTGSAAVTSLTTSLVTLPGKLVMPGISGTLALSNNNEGILYYDDGYDIFRVSQSGSGYFPLIADHSVTHTDGYVLTWINSDGYWAARSSTGGGASNIYTTIVKNGVGSVSSTDQVILADLSGSGFTLTLTATPSAGQWHKFKDYNGNAGTNNLTISGNGKNIEQFFGAPTGSLVMNSNYDSVQLMYNGTFWSIL